MSAAWMFIWFLTFLGFRAAVKGPFAILAAELDETTPVAEVEEFKKVLQSQNEVIFLPFKGTFRIFRGLISVQNYYLA